MLLELEVNGFALVDHLVLEFAPGLTVLTGETGTGKSIVLESLSFLLGSSLRSSDSSRDCRVAGRFAPTRKVRDFLEGQSLPVDEDELLIIRERKAGGRTISRLNGSLVSVAQLKELSRLLIDFQGQHQSYSLTRPSTHLPILDSLAGAAQAEELIRYARLYGERAGLLEEIAGLEGTERQRLREIEWLRLEIEDIDSVAPLPGEDLKLQVEIKKLAAYDELKRGATAALSLLHSEGAALELIAKAKAQLSAILIYDSSMSGYSDRLGSMEIEAKELVRELACYVDDIEHNPAQLDRLQEREYRLKDIKRKYGATLEEVLLHQSTTKAKLERLENYEHNLQQLAQRLQDIELRMGSSAEVLAERRLKVSVELCELMSQELTELGMPGSMFRVEFSRLEQLGPNGIEEAQFLFSANPGRALEPLAEIASGGELSRLMLALTAVVSEVQKQPTLVFDEIDSGLGGRAAIFVAQRLAGLSLRAQVLAVTHLPVVASIASHHYVVEKDTRRGSTKIKVGAVRDEKRVEEIARMLSGDSSPETSRKLALELLKRKPDIAEERPHFRL